MRSAQSTPGASGALRDPVEDPIEVVLSAARRVRHVAVRAFGPPRPLCGTSGTFPHLEWESTSPDVSWCQRCAARAALLHQATSPGGEFWTRLRDAETALRRVALLLAGGHPADSSGVVYVPARKVLEIVAPWAMSDPDAGAGVAVVVGQSEGGAPR